MKILTLTLLAGMAVWATSGPTSGWTVNSSAVVAYQVPAPPTLDPTFPETPLQDRPSELDDDDTADAEESLDVDADQDNDVHLESPVNNDVHAPLLEDDTVEPVDILPNDNPERFPLKDQQMQDPAMGPEPWI